MLRTDNSSIYATLRLAIPIVIALALSTHSYARELATLYPSEKLLSGAGYPALVYFKKGHPEKPLIVGIPGGAHLARVFYGCSSCSNEDFLAHWIHELGYSFAAISYPVDHPIFQSTHPEFSIKAWGAQAAEISKTLIDSHNLAPRVVCIGWSMAGKITQPFFYAAKERQLDVILYISLSATAPLPFQIPGLQNAIQRSPSGLADISSLYESFVESIREQSQLNGREIIAENAYLSEFLGNLPVALLGTPLRNGEGTFEQDLEVALADMGTFQYADFPLVGMLLANSTSEARHALTDYGTWSFYISQKIYRHLISLEKQFGDMSRAQWSEAMRLSQAAPSRLTRTVSGNHFFFVGRQGANESAEKIIFILEEARALMKDLDNLSR